MTDALDVRVLHSFRTPFALGDAQPALSDHYIALPFVRTSVGIWQVASLSSKPIELEGHTARVSALRFGRSPRGTVLVTAGNDYVIHWNIEECVESAKHGLAPRGRILAPIGGSCSDGPCLVAWIALDIKRGLVGACVERAASIWHIESKELVICLEGHDGRITCAEFIDCYDSVLVTASEDRTYKVWDFKMKEVLFQSAIMSSSPFTSLSMNAWDQELVLGTSDGMVFFVEMPKSGAAGFKCARKVDVHKALTLQRQVMAAEVAIRSIESADKVLSSRPSWQSLGAAAGDAAVAINDPDVADVILGLHFAYLSEDALKLEADTSRHSCGSINNLLNSRVLLTAATTTGIVYIDARSCEIVCCLDLSSVMPSGNTLVQDDRATPAAVASSLLGCCCIVDGGTPTEIAILAGCLFEKVAHLYSAKIAACTRPNAGVLHDTCLSSAGQADASGPATVSTLSSAPLLPSSPLNVRLNPKPIDQSKKGQGSAKTKPGKMPGQSLLHQSVTIHSKIKSSGYAQSDPRRVMFKPAVMNKKGGSKMRLQPHLKDTVGVGSLAAAMQKPCAWTISSEPPSAEIRGTVRVDAHPTCINVLNFSPSGQQLLCALSNKSAVSLRIPLDGDSDDAAVYSGHDAAVTSACWSRDGQYIVTGSADRTAALWARGQPDPLMVFRRVHNNLKTDGPAALIQANSEFPAEIRHAQFYYMDQFILVACANSLRVYSCHIDPTKCDIKRYKERSKYKMAACVSMATAQTITAVAAINEFYSYIVLCAGSDRSLEVFDLNVNRQVRSISDVHSRHAHTVCLYEGSVGADADAGQAAYNLFLTAAVTDGIKLWDLRANRCVSRYDCHKSRAIPCGLAWSPCGRYAATGSEDKTAYVFDVSSGQVVTRLSGHSDAVTCVALHPYRREVATGSSDGIVRVHF